MNNKSKMKCLLRMKLRTVIWCGGGVIIIFIVGQFFIQGRDELIFDSKNNSKFYHQVPGNYNLQDVQEPVILWWTPFTGQSGTVRYCGSVKCFFTEDRRFKNHPLTKAFVFYGSKFDLIDLPLPRHGLIYDWALLHEESPKNVPALSHLETLELFNVTATFSRYSHFPLTLQYLKNEDALTGIKYFVPLEQKERLLMDLAPVIYVHSDCSTPLDRDSYATELMKYIKIDSYGKCVQNRKLPEHLSDPMESMDSDEFLHFVARYKFTLSFENAACEDYITEKLWRPLVVGSVPIYMGSPSVRNWLPNNNSAIIASDFKSPKELADFLHVLNKDNNLYKSFLQHKLARSDDKITNTQLLYALQSRKWGIDNDFEKGNFIEHFECFICEHEHKKIISKTSNIMSVSKDHYNCPVPLSSLSKKKDTKNWWVDQWYMGRCEARVLKKFIELGKTDYTYDEFYEELKNMFSTKEC